MMLYGNISAVEVWVNDARHCRHDRADLVDIFSSMKRKAVDITVHSTMLLLSVAVLVVTTCADVLYYENIQSQEVRDNWETYPLGIIQNTFYHILLLFIKSYGTILTSKL